MTTKSLDSSIDAGTAVLAADSPTGTDIETAPPRELPAPEIIQPQDIKEKPVRQAGVKTSKVDVMKELGLKASPSELVAAEAKRIRDASGKFTKTEEKPPEPKLGEAKVKPEKPVVAAAAPVAKVETPPAPVTKVEPAKIKIGDQEKTAEEWAAYHKELTDKAKPVEVKVDPAEPVKTPEEQQAADKKVRDEWFEKAADRFAPDQKELDEMIANGDPKAFGKMLAKVAEDTRQWVEWKMKPHLEKLMGFDTRLNPILERDQQIAAYQAESEYLESNQDIKGHAEGLATMREVSQALHDEHDDLLQLLSVNPNSTRAAAQQKRATELEQNFIPVLTAAVKARLGLNTAPVKPAAVVAKVDPPVVKARPPAQGGQLSVSGSPKKSSDAASQIAELKARGLM